VFGAVSVFGAAPERRGVMRKRRLHCHSTGTVQTPRAIGRGYEFSLTRLQANLIELMRAANIHHFGDMFEWDIFIGDE